MGCQNQATELRSAQCIWFYAMIILMIIAMTECIMDFRGSTNFCILQLHWERHKREKRTKKYSTLST